MNDVRDYPTMNVIQKLESKKDCDITLMYDFMCVCINKDTIDNLHT
jgi:hypothetical protein